MRNDWPWRGLAICLTAAVIFYCRALMGLAIQRMGTWPSCLAGLALLAITYQFVLQAAWKRVSQPADDPWAAEPSDLNSQTQLLYVLGVIGLYFVTIYFALATLLFPAYMGVNIVKIGAGLALADRCIRVARRRTVAASRAPETVLDQTGSQSAASMDQVSPDAPMKPPSPDRMTRDALITIGVAATTVICLCLVLVLQTGKIDYREIAMAGAIPVVIVLGWTILRRMK
jgi:hypothetical protein